MSANGARLTRIVKDELGSDEPRRELIVQRDDGTTYSAEVPASTDLGEVLQVGDVVGFDGGQSA